MVCSCNLSALEDQKLQAILGYMGVYLRWVSVCLWGNLTGNVTGVLCQAVSEKH